MIYIAVDIGGTQIRAATYRSDSYQPVQVMRIPTRDRSAPPLERIRTLVADIWPQGERVAGIGVAAPGPTDPFRGVVIEAPNIPGWLDVPLRSYLEEAFQVPIALGNDANLAALGEWKFGAGVGHHHLVYVTISTGIGSGIIVDDRLVLGARGLAGEVGHITVIPDGPLCGCGNRGHLEAIASGTAIARWAQEQIKAGAVTSLPAGKTLTAKMISQAADAGDPLSVAAISRAAHFLGVALADILHMFNPTAIVLGGGVSRSGKHLLEPMFESLKNHVMHPGYLEGLVISEAAFGDDAGLTGAFALIHTVVLP